MGSTCSTHMDRQSPPTAETRAVTLSIPQLNLWFIHYPPQLPSPLWEGKREGNVQMTMSRGGREERSLSNLVQFGEARRPIWRCNRIFSLFVCCWWLWCRLPSYMFIAVYPSVPSNSIPLQPVFFSLSLSLSLTHTHTHTHTHTYTHSFSKFPFSVIIHLCLRRPSVLLPCRKSFLIFAYFVSAVCVRDGVKLCQIFLWLRCYCCCCWRCCWCIA